MSAGVFGESHKTVNWMVCNGTLARVARVNQWLLHQRTRLENDKAMVVVLRRQEMGDVKV